MCVHCVSDMNGSKRQEVLEETFFSTLSVVISFLNKIQVKAIVLQYNSVSTVKIQRQIFAAFQRRIWHRQRT